MDPLGSLADKDLVVNLAHRVMKEQGVTKDHKVRQVILVQEALLV